MITGNPDENAVLVLDAQIAADLARVAVLRLARGACLGQAAAATALNQATVLLQNVADLASAVAPEPEADLFQASMVAPPTIQGRAASLQESRFKTNDILKVRGSLSGDRSLQISGLSSIPLGQRPFLVLKVLARHAHANPGAFISVNEILEALQEDPAKIDAGVWEDVCPEDVHKAIGSLREEITEVGGNFRVLESSESYGGGYRLSTPCYNILLEDLDAE